jgi:hypothetical protein
MKKFIFATTLLGLLASCSTKKGDLSSLQPDQPTLSKSEVPLVDTVEEPRKETFFSQDLNYGCEEGSECSNSVALVAIKDEDNKIQTCTGTLADDSSVYITSDCLGELELTQVLLCNEHVEVKSLDGTIAKCESIEVEYSSTSKETIALIKLDREINAEGTNIETISEESNSVKAISIVNSQQKSQNCEVTYTSLANLKSLKPTSEYLDIKNCALEKSSPIFQGDNLVAITTSKNAEVELFNAVNASCFVDSCNLELTTKEDKIALAIENGNNTRNKSILSKTSRGLSTSSVSYPKYLKHAASDSLTLSPDFNHICIKNNIDEIYISRLKFDFTLSSLNEPLITKNVSRIRTTYISSRSLADIRLPKPRNILEKIARDKKLDQENGYYIKKDSLPTGIEVLRSFSRLITNDYERINGFIKFQSCK